jgi:hypothetical protein
LIPTQYNTVAGAIPARSSNLPNPNNNMPEWSQHNKTVTVGGVDLLVRERMDSRNQHGATEYLVSARINGELILTERHPWNVWVGHCNGQLLLPLIAKRARDAKSASALVDELETP